MTWRSAGLVAAVGDGDLLSDNCENKRDLLYEGKGIILSSEGCSWINCDGRCVVIH